MTSQTSMEKTREAALGLLKSGLASPHEVAVLAKVSQQLVRYWIRSAGVNWREARTAALVKAWRKAIKS